MRYVMLVCADPEGEEYVPGGDNVADWVDEMDRRKVRILGNRLKGVEYAISVRRRKGKVLVTDGPFAETREWIGGRAPTSTRPSRLLKTSDGLLRQD